VKLERNYRSTLAIITAADALIKHNTQTEKDLTTDKFGVPVDFREPEDDYTEITDIMERLAANQRLERWKTTAILTRTNKQIERAKRILREHGIPCETTTAADSPLAGKGARELLAWITAIENPEDDAAIRKIAASKMGKADILKAEKVQIQLNVTLSDALRETMAGARFWDFYSAQKDLFRAYDSVTEAANRLCMELGIDDAGARYAISKWEQRQIDLGERHTASDLLNWVRMSNVSDKPAKERDADKVHLMTVHGSKGLEFDEVYIIGAAQGTFPSRGNLEEERRLFYVAITRAREYLNISCPRAMADWNGNVAATERSQFIREALTLENAGR
jgi:DNA helicase-2/ATP-dependent DNA helicase PcrA